MKMVRIRLLSADPMYLLNMIERENILMFDIESIDALTVEFSLGFRDMKKLKELARKQDASVCILARLGVGWWLNAVVSRPVLLMLLIVCLFLTLFIPSRILFIKVQGCNEEGERKILALADSCGIHFAAKRGSIRSEKVKNSLISMWDEIEWVGVNTRGCVAFISVKLTEKEAVSLSVKSEMGLVASRDGIVRSVTVTSGSPLCTVGEAVKEGQLLISPYQESDLVIRAESAQGEIYADTLHTLELITPYNHTIRDEVTGKKKKYSLKIGKKSIKFYKDSGILDTSCVKMYDEIKFSLGDDFVLPISLQICSEVQYSKKQTGIPQEGVAAAAQLLARQYLFSQMRGGIVRSERIESIVEDDMLILHGKYACCEMIAQANGKELEPAYGKRD